MQEREIEYESVCIARGVTWANKSGKIKPHSKHLRLGWVRLDYISLGLIRFSLLG